MAKETAAAGWYGYGKQGRSGEWDGSTWTGRNRLDPTVPAPAAWHHRPFAFLGHLWFWLLVGGVVIVGISGTIGNASGGDAWRILTAVGLIPAGLAFVFLVQRHLHFEQLSQLWLFVAIGLAAGVIAAFAGTLIEGVWEPALGFPFAADLWLSGFVEETLKLLIPFLLLVFARRVFGDPRAGVLMALLSGAAFGVVEGLQYVSRGGENSLLVMGWVRALAETCHSLWTAIAAVLIWLAAHRAKRILTVAGVSGWLVAAVLHSVHDGMGAGGSTGTENRTGDKDYDTTAKIAEVVVGSNAVSIIFAVIAFLILRHVARELVPPTAIETNSPHWRPQLHPWGVPHSRRHDLDVDTVKA